MCAVLVLGDRACADNNTIAQTSLQKVPLLILLNKRNLLFSSASHENDLLTRQWALAYAALYCLGPHGTHSVTYVVISNERFFIDTFLFAYTVMLSWFINCSSQWQKGGSNDATVRLNTFSSLSFSLLCGL